MKVNASMNYIDFLSSKIKRSQMNGFEFKNFILPLFDWQKEIVSMACRIGKFAIFADCGMGKTLMQLEWCAQVHAMHGKKVLILCPLAVSEQTSREGERFGINVKLCRSGEDMINGINITNYEMLSHFSPDSLSAIVLDESSILKNYSGKIRQAITDFSRNIPFRLCCTATPAPNDLMEIGTHSEFLGVMRRVEMLATYFTHDSGDTQKWRLKYHGTIPFFKWMSTWCIALRSPKDMGFEDSRFVLPPLSINEVVVDSAPIPGRLFSVDAKTLIERRDARRESISNRVRCVADLVNNSDESWVVWCDLNRESSELARSIPGSDELRGSDTAENKVKILERFSNGECRVLVTKPSIAGFGLNWQHCARMAFTGLSDSYEQYYQAVRRCWRFGQQREVHVYIVTSRSEGAVLENIRRKEAESEKMHKGLIENILLAMEKNNEISA